MALKKHDLFQMLNEIWYELIIVNRMLGQMLGMTLGFMLGFMLGISGIPIAQNTFKYRDSYNRMLGLAQNVTSIPK